MNPHDVAIERVQATGRLLRAHARTFDLARAEASKEGDELIVALLGDARDALLGASEKIDSLARPSAPRLTCADSFPRPGFTTDDAPPREERR